MVSKCGYRYGETAALGTILGGTGSEDKALLDFAHSTVFQKDGILCVFIDFPKNACRVFFRISIFLNLCVTPLV